MSTADKAAKCIEDQQAYIKALEKKIERINKATENNAVLYFEAAQKFTEAKKEIGILNAKYAKAFELSWEYAVNFEALELERDIIEYERGYYAQAIYQLSLEGNRVAKATLQHITEYRESKQL